MLTLINNNQKLYNLNNWSLNFTISEIYDSYKNCKKGAVTFNNRSVPFLQLSYDFSISEIYDAYKNCKKGKKSINALKFEFNLEENLYDLKNELNSNSYNISRAICFIVIKPKIREIWASDFRDRVVHHLITRKIEKYYEDSQNNFCFLESSYANRREKGTHSAVLKLKKLVKINKYYLKLDIKSFFNSIDRNILFSILKNDLNEINFQNKYKILDLFEKIIFHNYTNNFYKKSNKELFNLVPYHKSLFSSEPNNKGLPIGNLTSQFLSNVYLNKLEYFIEKQLGFCNYIRYVDDFVILTNNKEELKELMKKIDLFLKENLSLQIHPDKIILNNVEDGIDFLGYFIKPKYTLVRKNVVKNLKEKLYYLLKEYKTSNKKLTKNQITNILYLINSYFGHFKYSNSHNLKRKMSKKLDEYFTLKKNSNNNLILKQKNNLNFENVFKQYNYFKQKYKNHLIIFQMGNFYRFFDEQAEYISAKINLKTQIKKYSKFNHLVCGFPIISKKHISLIENLNINYCLVKQLKNELISGLKERIEEKIISNKDNLSIPGGFQIESEDLNSILKWDLNSMTPNEVFNKIYKLQKTYK